jgi:CubicO group peptidase (beta-lactamase class C family)
MKSFKVITSCFVLLALTGCTTTYLGRVITLRAPDVEDYRHMPTRAVPNGAEVLPLTSRPNIDWIAPLKLSHKGSAISDAARLDTFLAENHTNAFILIADGNVMYERYFHGYQPDTPHKSFSMSKSVLSAMFGIAQDEGLISADDNLGKHIPGISNPALANLKLKYLLDNVSGFKYERGNLPWKHQPRMYYTTDVRAYVQTAELLHPPGTRFDAEDISPLLIGVALESALKKRDAKATLADYASTKIWQPMGAQYPAVWTLDRADDGMEKVESGLVARPIDLARFGMLYLNNGALSDRQIGKQIVPAAWVQSSTTPPARGSQNLFKEGFFQNLWWGATRPGRKQSDFYANGHFGQRIYVSPDKKLVIVRLGSESGNVNWTEWLAGVADGWAAR